MNPETEHPVADEPAAAQMPERRNPSAGSCAGSSGHGNAENMKGTLQRLQRLEELKVKMDLLRREVETRSMQNNNTVPCMLNSRCMHELCCVVRKSRSPSLASGSSGMKSTGDR